jgi:DNA topoisomerase VI subunit B
MTVAETEASRMRKINPAQYYRDNLGQLGFGDLEHAMLQTVKELVDNGLDAAELMRVPAYVRIEIEALNRSYEVTSKDGEVKAFPIYRIRVDDNGLGVVRQKVSRCFGTVLYGSKFFSFKQSRGQQGIGVHAAIIYAQLTSLDPAIITTKTAEDNLAYQIHLKIDCDHNKPIIIKDSFVKFDRPHGTSVEVRIAGKYSDRIRRYIEELSIANPHAQVRLKVKQSPEAEPEVLLIKRSTEQIPPPGEEIKPHILSVEPGFLEDMIHRDDCCKNAATFLSKHFCKISRPKAAELIAKTGTKPEAPVDSLRVEAILKAAKSLRLAKPPLDVLSPIGQESLQRALKKLYPDAELIDAIARDPWSFRGIPFQIEVAVAFGGKSVERDCQVSREGVVRPRIIRVANKCPLIYDSRDCLLYRVVRDLDWRIYKLIQAEGGLPSAAMVQVISITSSRVPYVGPGKYAIAFHQEIYDEAKLAVQTLGRIIREHIHHKQKIEFERKRMSIFQIYGAEIARDLSMVTGEDRVRLYRNLLSMIKTTAVLAASETKRAEEKLAAKAPVVQTIEVPEEDSEATTEVPIAITPAPPSPEPIEVSVTGKKSRQPTLDNFFTGGP